MIAMSSNWRDVQKYYEHSYIKIQGYGDKLFYVNRVRETMLQGVDEEDTLFELYLSDDAPFLIDYVLPHRAVFQYGKDVMQLRRNPSRQYRRGLHQDNTTIISVTTGQAYDLSFGLLRAFVEKQKYVSLNEAMEHRSIYMGVALTPRMSYIRAGGELRIDLTTVATVQSIKRTIKVKRPIFTKEIMQYLKDNNQAFEVIV